MFIKYYNSQKVDTTQISTDRLVNKIWNTFIIEYYSTMKSNKIPIHAAKWMNHENIILNDKSQTQKAYCMIPLT